MWRIFVLVQLKNFKKFKICRSLESKTVLFFSQKGIEVTYCLIARAFTERGLG